PSSSAAKDVGATPTDDSSAGKLRSSPVGDPANHPLTALFDGETGPHAGWVSPLRPVESAASEETTPAGDEAKPPLFPLDIAVRLRERRAWKIDSVVLETEFDPTRILLGEPGRTAESLTDKDKAACRVKEFEVFTSDSPVTGWTSAGRMIVPLGDTAATLSFPTREAEYVLVRIHSNHGGRCVGLGELRVMAVEPRPPEGSHSTAENVWPNVAAMGHRPHALWQVLAYIFLTAAEILVSITCLEFSYTQAPKRLKSIVMSLYLLSVSAGNVLTSAINHWIANPDGTSRLPGASYYWLFMGIVTLAAILFIPIAMTYRGKTYIQDEELSQKSEPERK
ncbi:MAG: hypothetical protein KF861_20715, partial [Planctomycetaceae bacterium]|nr:hypothetical protein [Planctomycetaceae bacterium]